MPPRRRARCQICTKDESKYSCSGCLAPYCSVPCYKTHKETCVLDRSPSFKETADDVLGGKYLEQGVVMDHDAGIAPRDDYNTEIPLEEPRALRPLTSLNWPYIPDESAYPDPLKRDDPKTIQLHQYEAIATSEAIRSILSTHPNLRPLLVSIDKLRGPDREHALQTALGVAPSDIRDINAPADIGDDILAFRKLAEAVESSIRGNDSSTLGLDWEE